MLRKRHIGEGAEFSLRAPRSRWPRVGSGCLGKCPKRYPSRPQTVTPGSSSGLNPTRVIAPRDLPDAIREKTPASGQGEAIPKPTVTTGRRPSVPGSALPRIHHRRECLGYITDTEPVFDSDRFIELVRPTCSSDFRNRSTGRPNGGVVSAMVGPLPNMDGGWLAVGESGVWRRHCR